MKVDLVAALSDRRLDASQPSSQRQIAFSLTAADDGTGKRAPLNLCLLLDRSGSMVGRPLERVKEAAGRIVAKLAPGDRVAIVAFDHEAEVLVPSQSFRDPQAAVDAIDRLAADGGTAIDKGLKLAVEELARGRGSNISQLFLLTDGENEHGDDERCAKLAELAVGYNLTLHCLGFGDRWNQNLLERLADAGGGSLCYIEHPDRAIAEFARLLERARAVGLTDAHLLLSVMPSVRLAELKPVAQVAPDAIELPLSLESGEYVTRLGDLMGDRPRVVLVNTYIAQLPPGKHAIARARVRYTDPATGERDKLSDPVTVEIEAVEDFSPTPDPQVNRYVLALAKYRQTQIAEAKLADGDRSSAVTLLQAAAKTALQLGDERGATVLQRSATQLQAGEDLSEGDRKQTRMVSKTVLKPGS